MKAGRSGIVVGFAALLVRSATWAQDDVVNSKHTMNARSGFRQGVPADFLGALRPTLSVTRSHVTRP